MSPLTTEAAGVPPALVVIRTNRFEPQCEGDMMNRWRIRAGVAATAIAGRRRAPKLLAFLCEAFLPSSGPVVLRCHSDAHFLEHHRLPRRRSVSVRAVVRTPRSHRRSRPPTAATRSESAGPYVGGVLIDTSLQLIGAGPDNDHRRRWRVSTHYRFVWRHDRADRDDQRGNDHWWRRETSPESIPLLGIPGVWATGGGVDIPPGADFSGGATVTISNSVITGNRADPTAEVDSGIPCPGFSDGECPYAAALGGGINSWGVLTILDSTVSDNSAGSAGTSSDAEGAGICSSSGSVTLTNTVMSGITQWRRGRTDAGLKAEQLTSAAWEPVRAIP